MKGLLMGFLTAVALACVTQGASAATYYVATNGSDGNPDRLFYNDVRSVTNANGGLILLAPRANSGLAPCGRDAAGAAFSCWVTRVRIRMGFPSRPLAVDVTSITAREPVIQPSLRLS